MKGKMSTVPSVRFERCLPGPIERVWHYLTDPEKLPEWFGQGTIELREGGQVRLMDGHIRGVVTQCRPPHLLIYTWNVFSPDQEVSEYPESYLKLELEPQEDGQVLLTLTHLPVLNWPNETSGVFPLTIAPVTEWQMGPISGYVSAVA
jgi:uncharacterized protein YndB with AHSA1/START domain